MHWGQSLSQLLTLSNHLPFDCPFRFSYGRNRDDNRPQTAPSASPDEQHRSAVHLPDKQHGSSVAHIMEDDDAAAARATRTVARTAAASAQVGRAPAHSAALRAA